MHVSTQGPLQMYQKFTTKFAYQLLHGLHIAMSCLEILKLKHFNLFIHPAQ